MRMRKSFCSLLVVIALAGVGSGCTIVEQQMGPPLPLDQMDDVPLSTHYADVLHRFGPPAKISPLAEGMVFQYEHVDVYERQVGLILPGQIGKLIKGVYASADADAETVVFVFDEDGLLVGSDVESWLGDPTPVRGGRRKRHYRLTPSGTRELTTIREIRNNMWAKKVAP